MKKFVFLASILFLWSLLSVREARACGHEGGYVGLAYTELLQFSNDKRYVSPTLPPASVDKISFSPRYGGQLKLGYDFCGTRYGIEMPIGINYLVLNELDRVLFLSLDTNAIIHIAETEEGADFYWIAGMGTSIATEGSIKDSSKAGGVNFNFGPGFQFFFAQGKRRAAFGISIPVRYTLYMGNNLSRNNTSVFAVPVNIGFTVGF